MSVEPDFPFADDPFDAFDVCQWCGGDFLPEDMDGEHCLACADEIFASEL